LSAADPPLPQESNTPIDAVLIGETIVIERDAARGQVRNGRIPVRQRRDPPRDGAPANMRIEDVLNAGPASRSRLRGLAEPARQSNGNPGFRLSGARGAEGSADDGGEELTPIRHVSGRSPVG
jgi:hypothetical protein